MNYITEQLCFLRYLRNHKLSSGEIALWYALFASSNNNGLGNEFTVSDSVLRIYSGLGQTRLAEARTSLIKHKLVACSPYQKRELRKYRLTCMEQLVNQSGEPQIFLFDSESVSNTDTNTETNSVNNSVSKSVSKSETYINKNINIKQKQDEKREAYGPFENVMLTEREMEQLHLYVTDANELIRRLSLYMESTGKQYRNHYATLLQWAEEDKAKKTAAQTEAEKTQALEDAIGLALIEKYRPEIASKPLTNTSNCDNIVSNTR